MRIYILTLLTITLLNSCAMKNQACKTENGYEIIGFGGMPINIDDRIEEGCKCLSNSLLWNPNPKLLDSEQLQEIRKELSNWAVKNISDFTEQDKKELDKELRVMSDTELLQKLNYRYSHFGKQVTKEIFVYTIKIKGNQAYCINYKEIYEYYNNVDAFPPNDEFYESLKKYYPIIENEDWVKNEFGDEGVVSIDNSLKINNTEIYP